MKKKNRLDYLHWNFLLLAGIFLVFFLLAMAYKDDISFEEPFDRAVEELEECLFENTKLYHELDGTFFNKSDTLMAINESNIRGQILDLDYGFYEKTYDGLRMESKTKVEALSKAREYDRRGDWVCVNVRNMDFERAVQVCQHEVGHEMFAEVCEYNMSKCLEVINDGN